MLNDVAQLKKPKDAHFALRLPSQTMLALKAAAEVDGRTASAFALRIIQQHLAKMVMNGDLVV